MQKRAVRTVVLVLLLGIGFGAALEAWGVERRLSALRRDYGELSNRIERLQTGITFIAAAQHAYIGSGQPDELSLDRVSILVQQIAADTGVVRTRMRAANSPSHLQAFADGLAGLIKADARARESLLNGQALAAADAVFHEARGDVEVMDAKLRELRYAESALVDAETSRLETRAVWTVGGVATLWALGLIAFSRVRPAGTPIAEIQPVAATPASETIELPRAPAVDLPAAAGVCSALSRITDASELPPLLGRAAAATDARGIIVWMGAGEELFPAASHGYDDALIAQLGAIGRAADNATAAAWRTGELSVVPADTMSNGAIVAPLLGTSGCIGVLAAELRPGAEMDPATRAVTSMIAAQLATVLSAWPAASTAAADAAVDVPDSGSERHAAAS